MKELLPIFIMVDACGWEIVREDPFVWGLAPFRRRLGSVFGYSSACAPSIVSGRWPEEHRNWCYFVYDPVRSPFKSLRGWGHLPRSLTSRRIFRRWLTRWVRHRLGFEGYFDLYNIPFEQIHLYDFSEKKSPLQAGGMNCGSNVFDYFESGGIRYYVSDPRRSESADVTEVTGRIRDESVDFVFLYWPGLDGLLHRVGPGSGEIGARLRQYEEWIEDIVEAARTHYAEARLYVFSDHGMATCEEQIDLKGAIESTGLRIGTDYVPVYDSTMARFWFLQPKARERVMRVLEGFGQGEVLTEEQLRRWRVFFPDSYFGELIFLVREGVLIVPSHMGERPIRAMHGYSPEAKQSYAVLCTNQPDVPEDTESIPDLYQLMRRDADLAVSRNRGGRENRREASLLRGRRA